MTVQDLGWRPDGRYKARNDDIATMAVWYGRSPTCPHPVNLDPAHLEVRSLQG